jgi:hypothetical protein
MRRVSDDFLLNMAEVSGTLIGLFLVGVFAYIEGGYRRLDSVRKGFEPYLRAGTRITLIVFVIPLGLSLTLVALELAWARALFVVLSMLLIVANVDTAVRVRGVAEITGSRGMLLTEISTTGLTVLVIVVPWALGGFHPTREDLTWAIILAFAAGFISIAATVMTAFDLSRVGPPTDAEGGAG